MPWRIPRACPQARRRLGRTAWADPFMRGFANLRIRHGQARSGDLVECCCLDRVELGKVLKRLEAGDVLMVTSTSSPERFGGATIPRLTIGIRAEETSLLEGWRCDDPLNAGQFHIMRWSRVGAGDGHSEQPGRQDRANNGIALQPPIKLASIVRRKRFVLVKNLARSHDTNLSDEAPQRIACYFLAH